MTESRAYINEIENEQTIIMNPNILPTQKEWQLVCKMVKQQRELTDKEIELLWDQSLNEKKGAELGFSTQTDYFNYLVKKAREK